MEIKIDKGLVQRISRLMMRMVPFLPVPEMDDLFSYIRRSQTDFDKQVREAVQALHNTSELVSTLQQRVEERMTKLQTLREEHDKYSELAKMFLVVTHSHSNRAAISEISQTWSVTPAAIAG